MDKIISFDKSLEGSKNSSLNRDHWKYVMDQWEGKNYKNAVIGVLDYVNKPAVEKYGNEDQTHFKIPHGSIIIEINISDSELQVKAPFLKLPEGAKVPILRQTAQLNFHPLKMSSIVLRDDELTFEFSSTLSTCEPYKVYDALSEITYFADNHDDEYVSKFKAIRLYEPEVEQYDDNTLESSWKRFQEIIAECNNYITYFESKRYQYFVWDIISITLRKIEYFLYPQGLLRVEIEKAINTLMNQQLNINDKIQQGKEFIQKLSNYEEDRFKADMYKPVIFVPYKTSSSVENVRKSLEANLKRFNEEVGKQDYLGASFTGLYAIYDLFYLYDMQDDIRVCLESALDQAQGKPYSEGCQTFMKAFEQINNGNFSSNNFVATRSSSVDIEGGRTGSPILN